MPIDNNHKDDRPKRWIPNSVRVKYALVSFWLMSDSRWRSLAFGDITTQPTDPCTELISAKFLERGSANDPVADVQITAIIPLLSLSER